MSNATLKYSFLYAPWYNIVQRIMRAKGRKYPVLISSIPAMCFEANGLSVYSSFFSISVRNLTRYTEGWNLPKNGYNLLKLSFYEIIYCIRAGYLAIPLYCTFSKILSPLCTIRYGSAHSRVFWCLHRLVVGGGSDLSSSDITKVILPKIML